MENLFVWLVAPFMQPEPLLAGLAVALIIYGYEKTFGKRLNNE